MNIKATYSIDDTLYNIRTGREPYWEECGFCGGTNKITGKDGTEKFCPAHHTISHPGKIQKWNELAWAVGTTITVRQIEIRIDGKGQDETYMAWERNTGGGTLYRIKNLFPTREEALAECEKRNQEDK